MGHPVSTALKVPAFISPTSGYAGHTEIIGAAPLEDCFLEILPSVRDRERLNLPDRDAEGFA